ncbi:MAG: hypothetical protein QOG72_2217 [Sphingomonadales bacterium]|jgi:hypothetical protein|nr:hypothetical protein [Sphingomonadales bacterium]
MRALIIVPLCLAAACSDGGQENEAAEDAVALQAGQWEISSEVTSFRSTDKATPALKAAVGDKATSPACIESGKEDKPPAEMFAGIGYECHYKDRYLRGGRINVSLECERDALEGKIQMTFEGTYTGDSFTGTANANSFLSGDGDFAMSTKMSGRRTGPTCAAPPEDKKGKAKA